MSKASPAPPRPSLVSVFENFFGEDINTLPKSVINSLPRNQLDDLVYIIDLFLEDAKKHDYPPEAVMLDSLSNPIIIPFDTTEPRTTRKAKQVALSHREVVIPFQALGIDYRCASNHKKARRYPAALLQWTRQNHVLLRQHVISVSGRPNILEVLGQDKVKQLTKELTDVFLTPNFRETRLRIIKPEEVGKAEEIDAINSWVYSMLMDAINANSINANLAFLDEDSGLVYQKIVASTKSLKIKRSPSVTDVQLLQSLDMPAIDDLPDHEFVAIRTQSDDFEEFRSALARVLAKTKTGVSSGESLQEIFKNNLDEIHIRADVLRREIKDKPLRKFLRTTLQGVSLGAITSTSAAAAADFVSGDSRPEALAARFLTTVGLGTLLAAVFYKPPNRQRRLLRFYNVLLDKKSDA